MHLLSEYRDDHVKVDQHDKYAFAHDRRHAVILADRHNAMVRN
jgi:hypothetical protein